PVRLRIVQIVHQRSRTCSAGPSHPTRQGFPVAMSAVRVAPHLEVLSTPYRAAFRTRRGQTNRRLPPRSMAPYLRTVLEPCTPECLPSALSFRRWSPPSASAHAILPGRNP